MKKVVSIIVPIYNAELSLERCLKSLIEQTYSFVEIVLVNDGSTDGSLALCKQYAEKVDNIIIVDKKNGGVSSARNAGIKKASGKYIMFVDSDDYLEKECCEIAIENIERTKAELVIFGFYQQKGNSIIEKKPIDKELTTNMEGLQKCFDTLFTKNMINTPWNKVYLKDNIEQEFDETISLGEDLLFNISYLKRCKNITIIPYPLYYYIISENSLSSGIKEYKNFLQDKLYIEVKNFCKEYFRIDYDISNIAMCFCNVTQGCLKAICYDRNQSFVWRIKSLKKLISEELIQEMFFYESIKSFYANMIKKNILKKNAVGLFIVLHINRIVKKIANIIVCNSKK